MSRRRDAGANSGQPSTMRVLHVINSLFVAGVEVLVREMAPRLRQHGITPAVAVLKELGTPLEYALRADGVQVIVLGNSIYVPDYILELARLMESFDVVQANLFPAQLWVAVAQASSRKHIPIVTTEQSTYNRRRKGYLHPLDRWMYSRYEKIACNSEGTAAEFRKWLPELAGKAMVIPNGVPLERFRNAAPLAEGMLPGEPPHIVFVARFNPAKDHATLIRAMRLIPRGTLWLVGEGESRPDWEQFVSELGLQQRVRFLGRRSDIPQILRSADIYVHSSNWEGFGIAAVEAMAAGLPVIASNVTGLADIVQGAGLLFPPGDCEKLAALIMSVVDSEELRARLIGEGRARAQAYSIEQTVDSYVAMYRAAVEAKSLTETTR